MLVLPTDPQEARFALSDFAEADHPPLSVLQELANVLVTGPDYVTACAAGLLRQRLSPIDAPEDGFNLSSPESRETVLAALRPHLHKFVWPVPSNLSPEEARRTCEIALVRAACGDNVADQLCEIAITTGFGTAQVALYQLRYFFPCEVAILQLKQVLTSVAKESIRSLAGSHLVRLGDRTAIPYFEDDLRKTTSMPRRLLKALGLAAVDSDYGTVTAIEIIDALSDAEYRDEGLKTVDFALSRFPDAPQSLHDVAQRLRTKLISKD
jgi:hypothetical protein